MQILKNFKRQSYPSRQSINRELQFNDNVIQRDTTTITEAINKFKKSIALANYRLCCICLGNYLGKLLIIIASK